MHRWHPSLVETWQRVHLVKLVRHAYGCIPLYRSLLEAVGCDPASVTSLADIQRLPIVDKYTFRNISPSQYTYMPGPEEQYAWTRTSGSTGVPFYAVKPMYGPGGITPPFVDMQYWRFLAWIGISIARLKRTGKIIYIREKDLPWLQVSRSPRWPVVTMRELLDDTDAALRYLCEEAKQATVISGYNSMLLELAKIVKNKEVQLCIPYALGSGDMLTESQRTFIEQYLNCELYNQYSSEELWVIGTECRNHDGFHVNSESFIVEIADQAGNRVSSGVEGRVIVTSLFNTAMPFIRYASGDTGCLLSDPCPCGLRTPRLRLKGREGFVIDLGNGKVHYIEMVAIMMRYAEDILQYQLVRASPATLEIHIVPKDASNTQLLDRIKRQVEETLGTSVDIVPIYVPSIKRTSRGKQQLYVDLAD